MAASSLIALVIPSTAALTSVAGAAGSGLSARSRCACLSLSLSFSRRFLFLFFFLFFFLSLLSSSLSEAEEWEEAEEDDEEEEEVAEEADERLLCLFRRDGELTRLMVELEPLRALIPRTTAGIATAAVDCACETAEAGRG